LAESHELGSPQSRFSVLVPKRWAAKDAKLHKLTVASLDTWRC